MKKLLLLVAVAAFFASMVITVNATTFDYAVTENGSDNYTLSFTVDNDTLLADIEWFSIYFGETVDGLNFTNSDQFSNFSPDDWGSGPESQPADWFSYSFEPTAIDVPGQFNADADVSGIAPGDTLGGFTVSFDWTGVGTLDDLFFEVGYFDPATFDYVWIDDGFGTNNTNDNPAAPVPEPATLILSFTGLVGLGLRMRRKRKRE